MLHRADAGRSGCIGTAGWSERPPRVFSRGAFWSTYPGFPPMPGRGVWDCGANNEWHVLDVDTQTIRWRAGSIDEVASAGDTTYLVGGSRVVSVDSETGAVLWKRRVGRGLLGRPGPPAVSGDRMLLSFSESLAALDRHSGTEMWRDTVGSDAFADTISGIAVAENSLVVVATSGAQSSDLERHAPRLAGLDAASGQRRWTLANRARAAFSYGIAVRDNVAYAADSTGHLFAVDAQTGAVIWEVDTGTKPESRTELAVDDKHVILATKLGTLRVFDRRDGSPGWAQHVGAHPTAPLICGSSVLIAAQSKLLAFASQGGELLWTQDLTSATGSKLTGSDELLVCTGQGIEVFARTTRPQTPQTPPGSRLRAI